MFYFNNNIPYLRGKIKERLNFSMEKSKFIPLSHTPGENVRLFGNDLGHIDKNVIREDPNKYYKPYIHGWRGDDLEHFRANFIKEVMSLPKLNIYLDNSKLRIRWARTLLNVSAHRLKIGHGQEVNGTSFNLIQNSTGLLNTVDSKVFYQFTFETKYIEELQKAILQGTAFKSKWFTLFMNPEVPVLVPNGKPINALRKHFLDPMKERGIDIVMSEDILKELSYTWEDVTYTFPPDLATSRALKKEARAEVFQEMLTTKQNSIKVQQNWELGLRSNVRIASFLLAKEGDEILNLFTDYIQETYYKDIVMEQNMRRNLNIGSMELEQVWEDGKWEKYDGIRNKNPLIMIFNSFITTSNANIFRSIKNEDYDETVTSSLSGYIIEYKEDAYYSDSQILANLYKVVNYKAIDYKLDDIDNPSIIYGMVTNTNYYYLPEIVTYANSIDIIKIDYDNIKYTITQTVNIMLSSDYINKREQVYENSLIYFADEDVLYTKMNNLLFKVKIASRIDIMLNLKLDNKILEGDPLLVTLFLNKMTATSILIGAESVYKSYLWEEENIPVTISDTDSTQGVPIVAGTRRTANGGIEVFNSNGEWVIVPENILREEEGLSDVEFESIEPGNMENLNRESYGF